MTEQTWTQPITKVEPNKIWIRGYQLDELMGEMPFAHVVYLVLKGELPTEAEGRVMDAILVASVDHGSTPPSAMAARTVASTGAPLTTGIAAGLMSINQYHGGAIEGCMNVLHDGVARHQETGQEMTIVAGEIVAEHRAAKQRLPGFGHRVHTDDPRVARLFALADETGVAGPHVAMARAIRQALQEALGKSLPLNVDGGIAALLCEMDFPPEMANGFFAMSRVVGLTAHVFDELVNQRPMRHISATAQAYNGPEERTL